MDEFAIATAAIHSSEIKLVPLTVSSRRTEVTSLAVGVRLTCSLVSSITRPLSLVLIVPRWISVTPDGWATVNSSCPSGRARR